jgi:DNA-binding CsgD family transcriptional regulator
MLLKAPRYAASVAELWGGPARFLTVPLEEPILQSQATPRKSWETNAYYCDITRPRGLHDCVACVVVRDDHAIGIIALGQHLEQGEVSEDTMAALRLIAPHLRRAVVISRMFEKQDRLTTTFADVLNGIVAGACIVAADMTLLYANDAADAMLRRSTPVRLRHNKLTVIDALPDQLLARAVAQAAGQEAFLDRRSIDIPVRQENGMPSILQVLPLKHRSQTNSNALQTGAAAAVFITDSAAPLRPPSDALALLYKLTPAETRVFELVLNGMTPAEISNAICISVPTVRTHLSRVFEKTGCERQADLVQLASRIPRIV